MVNEWPTWITQNILSGKVRFKDPLGDEFPKWKQLKLKDILDCKNSTHELKDVDKEAEGKFPLFTTGKLYKFVPWYDMETDYIAINLQGAPGKCMLLPGCSSVNSTQAYLTLKDDVDMNLIWILQNLEGIHFEKYIQGTTIKGLKWKDFYNEKINVPCIDEQNRIGEFINSFYRIAKLKEEEIELWKLLKKYLLQNMFV